MNKLKTWYSSEKEKNPSPWPQHFWILWVIAFLSIIQYHSSEKKEYGSTAIVLCQSKGTTLKVILWKTVTAIHISKICDNTEHDDKEKQAVLNLTDQINTEKIRDKSLQNNVSSNLLFNHSWHHCYLFILTRDQEKNKPKPNKNWAYHLTQFITMI